MEEMISILSEEIKKLRKERDQLLSVSDDAVPKAEKLLFLIEELRFLKPLSELLEEAEDCFQELLELGCGNTLIDLRAE